MTTSDARKRRHERDMADAHATARARDARLLTTHFTVTANGWVIDNQTGEFTPLTQETAMPEMNDVTSPAQLRHNGIVALLTEIRDRLPERTVVKVAPFDPNLIARNLDAIKHEAETPMREHGECCEPVEPGDLRAGDRVGFTWNGGRIIGALVSDQGVDALRSDAPDSGGYSPNVVHKGREWCAGISDVRLIERAPREDEDPDEALARVIFGDAYGSHEGLRLAQLDVARAARAHIESEERDSWVDYYRHRLVDRAEKAEAALADLTRQRDEWQARHAALRDDVDKYRCDMGYVESHEQVSLLGVQMRLGGILARDTQRGAR